MAQNGPFNPTHGLLKWSRSTKSTFLWLVNEYFRFMAFCLRNRNIEAIKLWHPYGWLGISFARDLHHRRIFVRSLLIVNCNEAVSGNVDAFTHGVIPEAVDAGNAFELRNLLACLRIEDNQHGRFAATKKKAVTACVQGKRTKVFRACDSPGRNLLARLPVNHAKFRRTVEVYENSRARFLKCDSTGPRVCLDIADMLIFRGIDNRQPSGISISESGIKIFRIRIVAHLVGVRAELQAVDKFKIVAAINFARAVGAIGHKKSLEFLRIKCALRFALPRNAGDSLARLNVNHLDGV